MACGKRNASLIADFNLLNIYGKCQKDDLIFEGDEKKEREKRFLEAQEEKRKEFEKQKKEKEKEELAVQECLAGFVSNSKSPPVMGRGRGTFLTSALANGHEEVKPRGRGRLLPQEKKRLPLFDRARRVENDLQQFGGDTRLHNNYRQKQYWMKLKNNGAEDELYVDCSSSTSDVFEDAEESPITDSPLSFESIPSHYTNSPVSPSPAFETSPSSYLMPPPTPPTDVMPLQPQYSTDNTISPSRPRKRASRLAAKFSNVEEQQDEPAQVTKEQEDPLSVLGSSRAPVARKLGSSVGSTFDRMNSSQRVLANNVVPPEDIWDNIQKSGFTLHMKDFPAL